MGNLTSNFKSKNNQRFEKENEKFKSAIKILKQEKYKYKRKLGVGTFGDVIEVRTSGWKRSKFAAKIVSSHECSYVELELWRSFQHDNVLPLLKILQESNVTIFIMPLHKTTMMKAIEEDSFYRNTESFNVSKNWITDVVKGLDYLHGINICHADLKANNVLITERRTAVICDFSFSSLMTGNISEYGLRQFFRPPEAFLPDDVFHSVNGEYFDVWSVGMLALYTWTRIWSDELVIPSIEYWQKFAYPVVFDYLQLPKFHELVKEYFPNAVITPEEISRALNLIQGVLQYEAEKRPPVTVILQHPLLNKEARQDNLFEVSSIWISRHFHLESDLQNASNDMDESSSVRENEYCIQDFNNFCAFTSASSENRTNAFDENTIDLSLSYDISSRTMLSTGAERSFDKPLHMYIMKNKTCNLEKKDIKVNVPMDNFEVSLDSKDMHDNQLSNAEITNKNLSSLTSEFCQSQLQYLGYSLIHELLMTL